MEMVNSKNGSKKTSKVLYSLKRNVADKVKTFVKLRLFESLILPVLLPILRRCLKRNDEKSRIFSEASSEVDYWSFL